MRKSLTIPGVPLAFRKNDLFSRFSRFSMNPVNQDKILQRLYVCMHQYNIGVLTFGSSIPLTTGCGRSRTKNAAKFAV